MVMILKQYSTHVNHVALHSKRLLADSQTFVFVNVEPTEYTFSKANETKFQHQQMHQHGLAAKMVKFGSPTSRKLVLSAAKAAPS